MIDHLLKFTSEAEAQADPVVGAYYTSDGGWRGDCCIPSIMVWQPAKDTTSTSTGPDGGTTTVTEHHPITDANGNPYWYVMIALPEVSADLQNHPGCMLVTDRDKANACAADFVVYTPIPAAALNSYRLQPVFAGAMYPFGSVTPQ